MKNKILVAISLFSLPLFAQTYSAEQFLKNGMELHGKTNYDEAISSYKKIHPSDPMYLTAQYEIINSLLANEKKEEALTLATELYKQNYHKEFPTLLAIYATALSENNQYEKAHQIFDEALAINPRSTHLLYNKGIVYIKENKNQEALDSFKKVIDIDPTHATALYNLGIIALEDGKIVEGSLSLMTYLLFEPYSTHSKNALLALNKKYHQNYANKSVLNYSDKGDNFKELEQMLLAQVQYNKNYQLKINIDDIAIRNMQIVIDYFENHNFKDGYFENKLAKNFQKIAQYQNTSNYLMTSLLSISSNFEKEFSKNEKIIKNYIETFLKNDIYENYTYGTFENKRYKVIREGNEKVFIPVNANNKFEGMGYVENILGAKRASLQYDNNEINGTKTYYFDNGNTSFIEIYKNGEIDGIAQSFTRNGKKAIEYYSVKDIANGDYKRFKPSGALDCEGTFVEDNYNGETKCYHADGSIQTIVNYKNGALHGPFKKYNEVGKIIVETNYADNEIDGSYKEFYHDGTLKQEAIYEKGKPISNINYHPNKKISSAYTYANGKLSKIEYFTANGQLSKRETYDSKEEYSMIEDFGLNNEKFQTHIFRNGNYSHSEYNLPNIDTSKAKDKNSYLSYNAVGVLLAEGNFHRNKPLGAWNYYSNLGTLSSKVTFDSEGNYLKSEGFLSNGEKDFIAHYKDGQYYGLYEDFFNNKINFTQYYDENGLNGPEVSYFTNGNKKTEGFYINNSLNNNVMYYTLDEKLFKKEYMINDEILKSEYLLADKNNTIDYYGKTGTFTVNLTPIVTREVSLKNGVFDGKLIEKSANIKTSEFVYKNGKFHGKQLLYGIHGRLESEIQYYNGQRHGEYKSYDENGVLKTTSNFVWDKENGVLTNFLPNGKKFTQYTYVDNEKHGIQYFYNGSDQEIASVEYYYGTPISYQILGSNGKLSDKKTITNEPLKIESFYSDGKKAFELHFNQRMYDNKLTIFYKNGNKALENHYQKNRKNGAETSYHENGKVYSEKNYVNSQLYGTVSFYDTNGNKTIQSNYTEDLLHGEYLIYENNNIKHKYIYNSDNLVSH